MDKSQNCQPKHPEPKKKVNLLINYVQRQDTNTVKLLFSSCCAHGVKGTTGDSGEDGAHGVGSGESVVLVVAEVLDNLTAILHESARQKEVCQIDIDNIYDKVQNFTEKKQAKISIIMMENTVKVCNIFSSNIFFDQTSFITEILHVTFQDDQLSCIFPK